MAGKWNPFGKKEGGEEGEQDTKEVDALLDKFSAKMEEKFKPHFDTVTELKKKWDAIEAEATKPPEEVRKPESEMTDDEKRNSREQALFALNVSTNARITESDCVQSVPEHWKEIVPDLRRMFAETPINIKAQNDYAQRCQNCVTVLIGRLAMSGGLRRDGNNKFYIEDAAGKTGGDDSPLNDFPVWQDPASGRTETASETLKKMGIDPVKFAESHKNGVV
jgi:hypothetical protein